MFADDQDGGEELEVQTADDVAGWVWKFSKSPLGTIHFLLYMRPRPTGRLW